MNEDRRQKEDANNNEEGLKPPPWKTNPYELLQKFEDPSIDEGEFNTVSDDSRARYEQLIELIREQNGDPKVAQRLWTMASQDGSNGAARALSGTARPVRWSIRGAIERYVNGYGVPTDDSRADAYRRALELIGRLEFMHPVAPLALAGTTDSEEIDLLSRAIEFERETKQYTTEDREFCDHAAEALAQSQCEEACQLLMVKLVESSFPTKYKPGGDILRALLKYRNPFVVKKCQSLLSLPKRKAVYRIAREYDNLGRVSAAYGALFERKVYDRVFHSFQTLVGEIRS